jgi:hypothetical protein
MLKKFIARWPGGSQNGKWWEIKGLMSYSGGCKKNKHFSYIFTRCDKVVPGLGATNLLLLLLLLLLPVSEFWSFLTFFNFAIF